MRYQYLCTALLAGLLATNPSADSARTDFQSATSSMKPSPTSDRDDGTSMTAPRFATIDGENRVLMTPEAFYKTVMLVRSNVFDAHESSELLNSLVDARMKPSHSFSSSALSSRPTKNLLADPDYIRWAFLISNDADKDAHEAIAKAMSAKYTTSQLINIFETAVKSEFEKFAIKLSDHVWHDRGLSPYDLLLALELETTVNNFLECPRFTIYASYLRFHKRDANDLVLYTTELTDLKRRYGEAAVVKILILPGNSNLAREKAYLEKLMKDWVTERKSPSIVGRLLVNGADPRTPFYLESNIKILTLWGSYLLQYNEAYEDDQQTLIHWLTETIGPVRSAIMLCAAARSQHWEIRDPARRSIEDLFFEWINGGKTPDDVSELLREFMSDKSLPGYRLESFVVQWTINSFKELYDNVNIPSIQHK